MLVMNSEVFLPWLYFSSVIFCVLLCNILHYVYHLFIKTAIQEEKNTIFDFLLRILSACGQVFSLINAYFLIILGINDFQEFNPWFVCALLNVRDICALVAFACIFLAELIFFFFFAVPDYTKNWNKNIVKNLSTFFLIIIPSYVLFIQMMTCGKESFCPPSFQTPGSFLPKISQDNSSNIRNFQKAILMNSMVTENACRGIVIKFIVLIFSLAIVFCTLGIMIKVILVKISLLPPPSLPPSTLSYPTMLAALWCSVVFRGPVVGALSPQNQTLAHLIFETLLPLVCLLTNKRLFLFTVALIKRGLACVGVHAP